MERSTMSLDLTIASKTDVGVERSENQDACGQRRIDDYDVCVVCDGMGGHAGGSTASKLAVETILDAFENLSDEPQVEERLRQAIETANGTVHQRANDEPSLRGMGTTVVALVFDHESEHAVVAHVGDSRIYRLRDGVVQRMTKDHTMVQRLVDDGLLSPEAAENHPKSNVISRSLGGREFVEVELGAHQLDTKEGDVWLLCSDGLHGLVGEAEIGQTMGNVAPDDAVAQLVERANEEGGHDNVTVQIALVGQLPEPDEVVVGLAWGAKPPLRSTPPEGTAAVDGNSAESLPAESPATDADLASADKVAAFVGEDDTRDDRMLLPFIMIAIFVVGMVFVMSQNIDLPRTNDAEEEGSGEQDEGVID